MEIIKIILAFTSIIWVIGATMGIFFFLIMNIFSAGFYSYALQKAEEKNDLEAVKEEKMERKWMKKEFLTNSWKWLIWPYFAISRKWIFGKLY